MGALLIIGVIVFILYSVLGAAQEVTDSVIDIDSGVLEVLNLEQPGEVAVSNGEVEMSNGVVLPDETVADAGDSVAVEELVPSLGDSDSVFSGGSAGGGGSVDVIYNEFPKIGMELEMKET